MLFSLQTSAHLLDCATDFGTTYSGWAYSFLNEFESDPTKASVKRYSGSGSLTTKKVPTCVLVQPDGKTLAAFGYEAENKYKDLVEKEEHGWYFCFKKLKMMLNKKLGEKLDREITLEEDEMGHSFLALDVFTMAIKYLKDDMLLGNKDRLTGTIHETDVHWVLTVPAIWADGEKQFIREAVNKAGITDKILTIELEQEAASIYCRNISVESAADHSSVAKFKSGTRYLVLDAGGGTIDITVHEVDELGGVKEVHSPCGGGWGGTIVDKAFEKMLSDIFTPDIYKMF